jgi:hypothetical protein
MRPNGSSASFSLLALLARQRSRHRWGEWQQQPAFSNPEMSLKSVFDSSAA